MSLPPTGAVYEYEPLVEERAIRLTFLEPSQDNSAPIHCSIKNSTLSHYDHELVDHYIAFSYVWGNQNDTRTIFVDKKPVKITESLASALCDLREQEPGRVLHLWADALCINQADVLEKNKQVQQMGAIYNTAHHTVIYLGPSTKEIDFVFDKFQLFQQKNTIPGRRVHIDDWNHQELHTVWNILGSRILARPWFKRVWVFQELVLSHDPWLQCGNRRMRWQKFYDISSLIEKEHAYLTNHDLDTTIFPELDVLKPLHEMQVRRCTFHYTAKLYNENSHYNSLLDLLSLRRGLGATDMRDLVFAHLGLAADYQKDPKVISIDYDMGCVRVFAEAARYIIEQGALDKVLEHVWNVVTVSRLPDLPSWTPDWSLAKRSRAVPPIWSNECATKNHNAVISFTPWTHIPMRLICRGWHLGKIVGLSKTQSCTEKSLDEIVDAWTNVITGPNSVLTKFVRPWDERRQEILVSLYNELLQTFGSNLQYLKIPPGLNVSESFECSHNMERWALDFLAFENAFDSNCLHPMALISLFSLGRCNVFGSQNMKFSHDRLVQDAPFLDGNQLGLLDFNTQSCKSTEKKKYFPLDMDGISCLTEMPFGLFPNSAKDGDAICILTGFPKIYICRPIEKSEGEDDGQHFTIIDECYVNHRHISNFSERRQDLPGDSLREFPTTDFVFH